MAKHGSPPGALLLIVALSVPDNDQVPAPEDVDPEVSPTAHAKPESLVSSTLTKHWEDAQLLFADARVLPFKMAVGPTVLWTPPPPQEAVMTVKISETSTYKHLDITCFSLPNTARCGIYTILPENVQVLRR